MYSFLHENQGHMWSSVDGEGGGPQLVEFYFEHGAPNSEEFNVSRQTVRNWARRKMCFYDGDSAQEVFLLCRLEAG